jgi:thiosulfate dehydrogenase
MPILEALGFLCSILIGVSLGLIGGGGSILTLPVLVYLLGLNPVMSTAYSLFVVGTTSLIGSFGFMQKGLINYQTALLFFIPSFLAVFLTRKYGMPALPDPLFVSEYLTLTKDEAIMVFFALIMLAASLSMIGDRKADASEKSSPYVLNYSKIILAGALVGTLTAFVGAGGGFLIIPALVILARLPMKVAVGTSLLIIAAKSLLGFLSDLATTQVSWPFLLAFTALSVVGIWIGSHLSRVISGDKLKKVFGYFVLAMSLYILLKETIIPHTSTTVDKKSVQTQLIKSAPNLRKIPYIQNAADNPNANLIRYGRNLIANTAYYLGPKGNVAAISNGMNCQNCHLEAGTKLWGNNYSAVAPTYPKFRERSGTKETIVKRISDCFERSLNGRAPDSASREMQAMVAYIRFIGQDVPKGESPKGSGIWSVPFLDRAADPAKGKLIYRQKCSSCHGTKGQGQLKADGTGYLYPPLWGKNSYTTAAGLYRLSRLAGFIKVNMPLGTSWEMPQLSDEQAWDLAAYINAQFRPVKHFNQDWPNLKGKPIDHPVGPFADPFSEQQHKYGPFKPIEQYRKSHL